MEILDSDFCEVLQVSDLATVIESSCKAEGER
jgi:hypothetical protein